MTITPKTTVHTLLKEYPFLLDFLAAYHPEFGKLTNPVLRRTMGRMATLDKAAQHRVGELTELRVVGGEVLEEEGILLEQRVHGGLARDRHTLLQWSGLGSDGMVPPGNGAAT